jgi:formate-dependent nitrite reductase membrane component NrfD
MLRVFKLRSPMSVGVWTLVAFSTAASAAAFADLIERQTEGRVPVRVIGNAAEVLSAATGLALATYTGVLLGATAIPVWSRNVRLLPIHFGMSGMSAAVSMLELLGHRDRRLNALGIGAAVVETAIGVAIEARSDPALQPLTHGPTGRITRLGGVLAGPVPLVLRIIGGRSSALRRAAAISTLAGSLLTRIGWIAAGRVSASSPAQPELPAPRPAPELPSSGDRDHV